MSAAREPVVSVLLDPDWAAGGLVDDVHRGLTRQPRVLPPKWLYDDLGSELFDRITRLPDYYPFLAERSILTAHAADIAAASVSHRAVEPTRSVNKNARNTSSVTAAPYVLAPRRSSTRRGAKGREEPQNLPQRSDTKNVLSPGQTLCIRQRVGEEGLEPPTPAV